MEHLEEIGFLKMDFLGLRNLSITRFNFKIFIIRKGRSKLQVDSIKGLQDFPLLARVRRREYSNWNPMGCVMY